MLNELKLCCIKNKLYKGVTQRCEIENQMPVQNKSYANIKLRKHEDCNSGWLHFKPR